MVEDYLTDRDQEEALRNWWRENWKWILAGVVLGLGLLAGYQYWQTYRGRESDEAHTTYADFQKALAGNDVEQAARLLLAKHHAEAGKFDDAITQLRQVADTSRDEELAHVARLRTARLLIQTGKHDEALQMLDVEKAGAFAAQVREVRGDALVAKGDAQGARAEYAAALSGDPKGDIDRATVELKLRDVGGEVPAAAPKAPAAKGDS